MVVWSRVVGAFCTQPRAMLWTDMKKLSRIFGRLQAQPGLYTLVDSTSRESSWVHWICQPALRLSGRVGRRWHPAGGVLVGYLNRLGLCGLGGLSIWIRLFLLYGPLAVGGVPEGALAGRIAGRDGPGD